MEKTEARSYDRFIAVMWGTENPENLASLTEKHPSLLLPLGSRCILSYQLDFLARSHIQRTIVNHLINPRDRCDNTNSLEVQAKPHKVPGEARH